MSSLIHGGYVLKARKIQESQIAHAPPYVREIWDWIVRTVNHKDTEVCQRGQTIKTFRDIQEDLCWYSGWRKETYTKDQCEKAMAWLRKASMVATQRTTRGMVITVLNYEKYQEPSNYGSDKGSNTEATRKLEGTATINNERIRMNKNEKKKESNIMQPAAAEEELKEIFSQEAKTAEMLGSSDKRMRIIASYWRVKGFEFANKQQYSAALKRELRASSDLTGYMLEQIQKTLDWLKNNANFKWTLETVGKYINEPLDALSIPGKPKSDDDWMQELRVKERQYATQPFT